MTSNWKISAGDVFAMGSLIPVLMIEEVEQAIPIAEALLEGGIKVLEVTLRTEKALEVINKISTELPEAFVGAGTVINPEMLTLAGQAGSKFIISPGLTPKLLTAANTGTVPLIPGISTISELMTGLEHGYDHFKFFPAEASGGTAALKAIGGPFPNIKFCPTGGINPENFAEYLLLKNVLCAGGSWLVTSEIVEAKNWPEITRRTKLALSTL